MELAGIQLEEVIAKLDREILTQRKQRLGLSNFPILICIVFDRFSVFG
jgi:hypothetical protein